MKKKEIWPTEVKPGWRLIYFRSGIHFLAYKRPSSFRTREPQDDEIAFAVFSIDAHINRFALRVIRWHGEQEIDDYFDRAVLGINLHAQAGLIIDILGFHLKFGR